ncbi:recombination directionality factor [Streptomyces sp. BBFR109]|uniref:recombination directionality factor n=1 Tax=Streptomyces sp. BBFR109 TaxID=3448172 RepID=UPI003F774E01
MGSRLRNIQRRAAEHGRLRTGYTQGNRPVRSATWVVSSHSEEHVRRAAELWGGEPEQWKPLNSTIEQWRVITKAPAIEALITPGDPLNQYNELWSAGGCQRRCDGETELLTRQPCICARQFGEDWFQRKKGTVCSATSRLNVMLPDLSGMGMWRAETHSFYAASEWGGMVDMVLAGTDGKGFVPVTLRIEPRQVVRDGKTKRFPVVVVELRGVTPRQALSGPMTAAVALAPGAEGESRLAIEAPRPDYLADAEGALTSDDVRDVWRRAREAGHVAKDGSDELSKKLMKLAALRDAEANDDSGAGGPEPDEDGVYEAEVVGEAHSVGGWPAAAAPGSGARR